jgi:uncharacterized protein
MDINPYAGDLVFGEKAKVQTVRSTGAVYMYGPEIDIIDTPEFQRLGSIKQLGTSYFVFRGAVHTRFEHSLGALQQAENIIDAVNRSTESRPVDKTGRRLARLAALLHDLPHIAFGHTLEDEFRLLDRHDENLARIETLLQSSQIGAILRRALSEDEYRRLLYVLDAVPVTEAERLQGLGDDKDLRTVTRLGEYAYVADIVANTVCADLLDYIVRDLSACGMPVAIGDRFLDFFVITPDNTPDPRNANRMALQLDKRGMPRPDVESEILKLLTYRYELAERVFFHHTKNAASVMIGRAVQLLRLEQDESNFYWLSDDLLLALLAQPDIADALGLKVTNDDERRQDAAQLGQRLARRELYKLCFLGVSDDDVSLQAADIFGRYGKTPGARSDLEDQLAAQAGLEPGRVLVHLPSPKMMMKLAKVRVRLENDTVSTFEEWDGRHSGRVRALNDAHRRLWRVAVYIHPDDAANAGQRRLVASAAREAFNLRSRYADVGVDSPYLATVFDLNVAERGWPAGEREEVLVAARKAAAAAAAPHTLGAAIEFLDNVIKAEADKKPMDDGKSGAAE